MGTDAVGEARGGLSVHVPEGPVLHFLTRIFGSRNERIVRGYGRLVGQAGQFEASMQQLSDEALGARTAEFRERLKQGATLDSLLHDPHLDAVDFFSWHEHPTEGRIRVMKPPSTSTLSPQTIRRHAPRLGEHTREVLGELGYRSTEIDALIATGCARQAREVEPPASGTD